MIMMELGENQPVQAQRHAVMGSVEDDDVAR
jgi:hypothetical protein